MKQMKIEVSLLFTMLIVLALSLAMSGCTSPTPAASPTAMPTPSPAVTPTATPVPGTAVLAVDGRVNTTLNMTVADLKNLPQYTAAWQNATGNLSFNGTGPRVLDILNTAGLMDDTTNITFLASDNYITSMTLADLNSRHNNSIVAWDWIRVNETGEEITNVNNTLQLIVPAGTFDDQVWTVIRITAS